jgi:hypothetical protein
MVLAMSETIRMTTYVSDLIALEREVVSPVEKQISDTDVIAYPEVKDLLTRLQNTLYQQILDLEQHLLNLGGHPAVSLKSAVADVMGAATSAVQSVRKTKISKMLRDDHTSLSLVCVAYEMLYTSARITHSDVTAQLALGQLKALTPLIMDVGDLIPAAVSKELLALDPNIDLNVLPDVAENISRTWKEGARDRSKTPPVEEYSLA